MSIRMVKKITCLLCGNTNNIKSLFPEYCSSSNFLCNKCGLVFIPREINYLKGYYKEDGYFKMSPNIASRPFFVSKSLLAHLGSIQVKK